MSLFGAKVHQDTSKMTTYEDIHMYYGWTYIVRLFASLLSWTASASAILCRRRVLNGTLQSEEDTILVLPPESDMCTDSMDDAENGSLL